MAMRGNLYSAAGVMQRIDSALERCLETLLGDDGLSKESIPLLIQKRCSPRRMQGHLSNERRCYEEGRDWMGEFEVSGTPGSSQFQINIRHWRKKFAPDLATSLSCSLSARISKVLEQPAEWVSQKQARVHFEWVWDGSTVYLVQADEEPDWAGHNPVKEHVSRSYKGVELTPVCLQRVKAGHERRFRRFRKVGNAFTYMNVGLPTAALYVLDDQKLIRDLSKGKISAGLRADIKTLVKGSLIVRTDLATDDVEARQLLPRTEEVRSYKGAIGWLIRHSQILSKSKYDSAFIFHNFIPAQSAAFAYADPESPFVQIESLWGLPEGLYYNSHDQFMVDTLKHDITSVSLSELSRFRIREKRNFKRFFVSTTPSGKWQTLPLKQPFDWQRSLSDDECRQIAYHSRRIAASENRALSVMWFVGVPPAIAKSPAIPWYHEPYDLTGRQLPLTSRKKTVFDRSFVIRSARDVEKVNKATFVTPQNRIRVQPEDEKLLRDKNTLNKIGAMARAKGATIVLEGGILSHAYYQLLQTGAIVEVVHPFIGFEERHEFNKLVRDGVPELIKKRGERVTIARLDDEAFVRALRAKLVEEAHELLDTKDLGAVMGELADIKEVIDSLLHRLKASKRDLDEEQKRKHRNHGGFKEGVVLVQTESQPPTAQRPEDQLNLNISHAERVPQRTIDEVEFRRCSESIERRPDRLVTPGKTELRLNLTVPVTRQVWAEETAQEQIQGAGHKIVTGRIKGSRAGPYWNFEIAISISDAQPQLL
jgi:predicted house-cleaning noncanonical NTP pyrophosphatase (MazG superfamily)